MSIFDSPTKKMSHDQLWQIIEAVSGLTHQEKEYAKAVLDKYTVKKMGEGQGGLTKQEALEGFRGLLANHNDFLSPDDIHHIESRIMEFYH
jgi:hypothetical protein